MNRKSDQEQQIINTKNLKTMTKILPILLLFFFLAGVQSSSAQSGKKQGEVLKAKIDAVMDPYHKPVSKSGLYLEAKIDGKKWMPEWMFVDPDPGKTFNVNAHQGTADAETQTVISFYISKETSKQKGSRNFSQNNILEFVYEHNFFEGSDGGYQITSVNDNWIEGNFHTTAKEVKSGKSHQIADGFFRVHTPEKWKKDL